MWWKPLPAFSGEVLWMELLKSRMYGWPSEYRQAVRKVLKSSYSPRLCSGETESLYLNETT